MLQGFFCVFWGVFYVNYCILAAALFQQQYVGQNFISLVYLFSKKAVSVKNSRRKIRHETVEEKSREIFFIVLPL